MICNGCGSEVADMKWHLSNECRGFHTNLLQPEPLDFSALNRVIKALEDGRVRLEVYGYNGPNLPPGYRIFIGEESN